MRIYFIANSDLRVDLKPFLSTKANPNNQNLLGPGRKELIGTCRMIPVAADFSVVHRLCPYVCVKNDGTFCIGGRLGTQDEGVNLVIERDYGIGWGAQGSKVEI
ncbi:hypothetical protein SDJN03_24178, partial [Cucurbita argyrosperma subsp. sororia]